MRVMERRTKERLVFLKTLDGHGHICKEGNFRRHISFYGAICFRKTTELINGPPSHTIVLVMKLNLERSRLCVMRSSIR